MNPSTSDTALKRRALLTKLLEQANVRTAARPAIPRRAAGGAGAPLSFAQERMWFLDQLDPDSAVYNVPTRVRLDGELDAAVLRRSLQELVRRHEILRSSYQAVPEGAVQVVEAVELEMPVVDLVHVPEPQRLEQAMRLCAEEAERPFEHAGAAHRFSPGPGLIGAVVLQKFVDKLTSTARPVALPAAAEVFLPE